MFLFFGLKKHDQGKRVNKKIGFKKLRCAGKRFDVYSFLAFNGSKLSWLERRASDREVAR